VKRLCPYCRRTDGLTKSGHNRSGTQRYKCVCGRTHTHQSGRKTSDLTHLAAALLHRAGYSLREVSSVLSLSHQAVKLWSEQYGSHIVITMDSIYDMPCFTFLANRIRYDDDDL
jgi:transposase-like protein